MTEQSGPTYDLAKVKALVSVGQFLLTGAAHSGLGELGFDPSDAEACVLALVASNFHKTMSSEQMPGLFQDVYKPSYCGHPLYVKLQIVPGKQADGQYVVIISFKRK